MRIQLSRYVPAAVLMEFPYPKSERAYPFVQSPRPYIDPANRMLQVLPTTTTRPVVIILGRRR